MPALFGAAGTSGLTQKTVGSGIPDYWSQFYGGGAETPQYQDPNWGGGGPVDGFFNNLPDVAPGAPGPELDPQMVEVAPPKLPDVARAGLSGASAAATGWSAQPTKQLSSGDIGKRIYPPGGTALTGKRVY